METVEFSRIGKSDLHTDAQPFEVRLADGRVVTLPPVDVGYWRDDACARAALSAADPVGQLRRLTDATRGLWRHGGGGHWYDLAGGLYNVQAFGARGNDTTDDTAALQAAIDACGQGGGGIVWFPPGAYRISSTLTVAYSSVILRGCGRGRGTTTLNAASTLRATAAMTNMVKFAASTLQHRGGVEALTLDGFGLADWCLAVDGWRDLNIDNNVGIDALVGFMHTEFSGVSDFALSTISRNFATLTHSVVGPGQGMSYFFKTDTEEGRSVDPITFIDNLHASFGRGRNSASWSFDLNAANRVSIFGHFAQPYESGTFDGIIWIHNSSSTAGESPGREGHHLISGLVAEWGSQSVPGILIDSDYTADASTKEINDVIIEYPRIQAGNFPVVKLDVTGASTTFVRRTKIMHPRVRLTSTTNTIVVNHANVLDTWIEGQGGTPGVVDAAISDSGTRTIVNGLTKTSALANGATPAAGDLDAGIRLVDTTENLFWEKTEAGTIISPLTGATQRSVAWVTDSTTAAQARTIPANAYLVAAHLEVTEAFNSSGTDLIRCGTTANGDNIFADIDVSTTGVKSVTLAGQDGFNASARAVHVTYTAGGSAPSTGAAIVLVEWAACPAQP